MQNCFIPKRSAARIPRPLRLLALALVVVAVGHVVASAWPRMPKSFDPRCDEWDRAAAAAVAALIAERDAVADRQLGDAVFRLRRARKNCRHDFVSLAWPDYRALTDGRYLNLR
jgi:hypothetical protein